VAHLVRQRPDIEVSYDLMSDADIAEDEHPTFAQTPAPARTDLQQRQSTNRSCARTQTPVAQLLLEAIKRGP
jgi:hypothetical protein